MTIPTEPTPATDTPLPALVDTQARNIRLLTALGWEVKRFGNVHLARRARFYLHTNDSHTYSCGEYTEEDAWSNAPDLTANTPEGAYWREKTLEHIEKWSAEHDRYFGVTTTLGTNGSWCGVFEGEHEPPDGDTIEEVFNADTRIEAFLQACDAAIKAMQDAEAAGAAEEEVRN